MPGCQESHVYFLQLGQAEANITSPNIISASPKNVFMFRLISQFFCNLNSSKNFTCLSDKLITEFTGPIAKSVSPRLSDTSFVVNDVQRLDHYSKSIMLTLTLTLFRDLDRERSKLEQQEKKVIADIKKMAKAGQMVCQ